MTSLGNVEATLLPPHTSISFKTGDILHLTGNARNLYGPDAQAIVPMQDRLTEIFVAGYSTFEIPPSLCGPLIKLSAEEDTHLTMFSIEQQPKVSLTRITVHNPGCASTDTCPRRDRA